MKPKSIYLLFCIVGTVVPYIEFIPFLRDHGFDLRLFLVELFSTRIGAFFGLDVVVSALVLLVLVFVEGRRSRVKHMWAPIAASLVVGVSLGLPLFLYLRESRLEHSGARNAAVSTP